MTKERAFRKGAFWAGWHIPRRPQARISERPGPGDRAFCQSDHRWRRSCTLFLQLPLEDLNFLGQRHIVADEAFDLAHGVQNRGVVAATEAPANLG